jgi:ketosteroid isomerase-like protein
MYRPNAVGVSGFGSFQNVESILRGLTQDYCMAFNTGNYDHAAALFTSEGIFMPPHRESSRGSKPIEILLRRFGESGYQDLRLETVRVESSGDMAIEIGRYTVNIQRADATLADRGEYVRGWHRLGAWLITADCWSSNLPLPDEVRLTSVRVA